MRVASYGAGTVRGMRLRLVKTKSGRTVSRYA